MEAAVKRNRIKAIRKQTCTEDVEMRFYKL